MVEPKLGKYVVAYSCNAISMTDKIMSLEMDINKYADMGYEVIGPATETRSYNDTRSHLMVIMKKKATRKKKD